jgi:hypothetical protein
MEEPPDQNRSREQHQTKRLIPHKRAPLLRPPLLLGELLLIRLNAGINHCVVLTPRFLARLTPQYRRV